MALVLLLRALLRSLQRLQHREIAGYGSAAALAGQFEFTADEEMLRTSFLEEKQTDASLTELAEREVNARKNVGIRPNTGRDRKLSADEL